MKQIEIHHQVTRKNMKRKTKSKVKEISCITMKTYYRGLHIATIKICLLLYTEFFIIN